MLLLLPSSSSFLTIKEISETTRPIITNFQAW